MTLSVVIGTRNRPESLRRCLESIVAQTVRPQEVHLIDDGQLDAQPLLALLQAAGITATYLNKSERPGLTRSRNIGIRHSTGDVVMFLDDDVELGSHYVEAVLNAYEQYPEASGVAGRLAGAALPWTKRLFLRAFLLDSAAEGSVLPNGVGVLVRGISRVTPVEWFSGCNMSYRRFVFDRFMFDEEFAGNGWGDDRDFSYSVSRSHVLLCVPDAEVWHHEEPKSRASDEQFGGMEIAYVHRFFRKHMPRRPANYLALWWAFTGIIVKNLAAWRIGRLTGNLRALLLLLRPSSLERVR